VISRLARWLAGFAFSIGFVLALLELALRVAPGLIGGGLGNALYSVYGDFAGGIYFRDREAHLSFMWPDFATRAYWNGYWWNHRTDAWGFRNPPDLASKSMLLLGDSLIYGHGVDEEDTVAHLLRQEHGRAAYNMGRQGNTLFQEYVLSRLYLPRFRPEQLVVFVFVNDFRDMEVYREPAEIAAPPELDRLDYDALYARVQHPKTRFRLREQLYRLRVWRLGVGIAAALRPHPASDEELREQFGAILDDARFEPIARYYRLVLADLARRCRAQGCELAVVLVDVPDTVLPNAAAPQDRLFGLLAAIGGEQGFRVLTTRELYRGCPECFLPHDGHLTREGHRRLAGLVAEQLAPPTPAAR